MANENSEIRYLNPPTVEVRKKKYCRFKKAGIKYVDYKDPEFLKKFLNEQGKILPRRITGTSLKFQRKVGQDPSPPYHRYFPEVPAQGRPGHQAGPFPCSSSVCY